MKSVLKVLVAARAVIENPKHWTSGALAKDAEGCRVNPDSPSACRFCAIGALAKACDVHGESMDSTNVFYRSDCVVAAAGAFRESAEPGRATIPAVMELYDWNDRTERKHEEVLARFDAAIDAARRKGL